MRIDSGPQRESVGIRRAAVGFLVLEGIGVLLWWLRLLLIPATRSWFLAPGAPDITLLAFGAADLLLYAGAAWGAAVGLVRRKRWAWPLLCIHTGAAAYAALYGVTLAALGGGSSALLMLPSLLVLPFLTWRLRPKDVL